MSLFICMMAFPDLHAQEMPGIVNSNYSGIHGALINPANLTNSKYYLDINFITVGIFAQNNYLYLAKEEYRFSRFLGKNGAFPTHPPNDLAVYDNENTSLIDAFVNERLMGPSAMLNVGKHAFGITTSFRTVASANNIPYQVAKLIYEGLDYSNQIGIQTPINKKSGVAAMSWAELGLSYAYVFRQVNHKYWSGGITIKRLMGYSGAYAYVDNINYILPDRETLIIDKLNAEAGFSLPIDYETNDFHNSPVFHGGGVGFDIGVTCQKMKKGYQNPHYHSLCSVPYKPYQYRIGISIIDIGRISFKKNAQKLVFDDAGTNWTNFRSINTTSINSAVRDISRHFFNSPDVLPQANRINIGLPTALSVQMDVNYTGNWYINGMLIFPLILDKASIVRPAQLAITPRYETDYFEVNLPISLYDYEYQKPRIGISARIGMLTIGTDKLGGFFSLNDFTGLDFYFAIKWSFLKGNCPGSKKTGIWNEQGNSCGNNEYKKFIKR